MITPPAIRLAIDRELIRRLEKAVPGDQDELPLLTRLSARMEPAARRAFLAAARGAAGVVDLEGLATALRTGQMTNIEAAAQIGKLSDDLRRQILPVLGRTFALGAQIGADAVPDGPAAIAYGFDLRNPEAIRWVREHGAELVTNVSDGTRSAIRSLVEVAQREGRHPFQTAREIREVIGLLPRQADIVQRFRQRLASEGVDDLAIERRAGRFAGAHLRQRAITIARTETLMASGQGQQSIWEAAKAQGLLDPARTQRQWLSTEDDLRDEAICEPMADQKTPLDEPWTLPDGRRVMVPTESHPQCFVPDTRVIARAVAGLKAAYAGPVVTLETRSGNRLTVTPNHPILTPRGWIAAGCLREGDDVLGERTRFHGALARWAPEDQNGPAAIEEIVKALRADGLRRVQIGCEDLHGDAFWTEGQIDIVGTDSVLRNSGYAVRMQRDAHRLFMSANVSQTSCSLTSGHAKRRQGDDPAARGHPRSRALALDSAAVLLERAPFEPFGLAASARLNAGIDQSHAYGAAANAQRISERFLRLAESIPFNKSSAVDIAAPCAPMSLDGTNDVPLVKASPDQIGGDAQLASDLLIREAGRIELDRLVSVQWDTWHGHVYDLQTADGFILAEGIVVSNCRCAAGLVFGESK